MRNLLPLVLLTACSPEPQAPPGPSSAPLAEPTAGSCPAFADDVVDFTSNGEAREALILTPDGGVTAESGIVFAWYGTGGSASWMASAMGLQSVADDTGHVVVVPEAMPSNILEWEFRTDGANDLAFYDDLRTCVTRTYGTDRDKVFTTGFSAGALWSSYLVVHRGDTLAGAVIYSGGTDPIFLYEPPDGPVPVALVSGGTGDTWGVPGLFEVEFEMTTENMRDSLLADGHTVVRCQHERGHTLPPEWRDLLIPWITDHAYGQTSPYAEGEMADLPTMCEFAG